MIKRVEPPTSQALAETLVKATQHLALGQQVVRLAAPQYPAAQRAALIEAFRRLGWTATQEAGVLVFRPAPGGRAARATRKQFAWTADWNEDTQTSIPITKRCPPWSLRADPAPPGAVLVTRRIAAWFNRVGYHHGTMPTESMWPNWSGYTAAHGGLYVAPSEDGAKSVAEGLVACRMEPTAWAVYRVHIQVGDHLAVDEDCWNYIQEPYRSERPREALQRWGAGASLDEFAAVTDADSMWRAPRVWAEAFVLRWSGPIIETCVRENLLDPAKLPNLRVWSTCPRGVRP